MLHILTIPVTPIAQNCRILYEAGAQEALVIDPGGDADVLLNELRSRNLVLREIWLTHAHFDHCGAVAPLIKETNASLTAHPDEAQFRSSVEMICKMYGMPPGSMVNCPEPQRIIRGGETLKFGSSSFRVLFTPGHSPGSVSFYNEAEGFVLSGDVLFQGSIGRTDLPGGDYALLMRSIESEIKVLPPNTKVLSGHGPDTTVGDECKTNPFLLGAA